MMRVALALGLAAGLWLGTACSHAGGGGDDADNPDGGDGDGNNNGSDDDGNNNNGFCTDPAKLVFTLEANKRLSKFNPSICTDGSNDTGPCTTNADCPGGGCGRFTQVGYLMCPGSSAFFQPFSMSVDRNAIAWVLYRDYTDPMVPPKLMRVDTSSPDLDCTETSWTPQLGLKLFSMGFSTDMEGSVSDELFVSGGPTTSGTTFARLDTATMTATALGQTSGWAELTGNAKGDLWAYLPLASPQKLQHLDKTNGMALQTYDLTVLTGSPNQWAFAWWGENFYVFYHRVSDPATLIYRFDEMGNYIDVTDTNSVGLTRNVVGAGVSTCAPIILL